MKLLAGAEDDAPNEKGFAALSDFPFDSRLIFVSEVEDLKDDELGSPDALLEIFEAIIVSEEDFSF